MSWFGETFGDSLNSLKGQITKITKEVLADDEGTATGTQESEIPITKELEALCLSKDCEIAALREELNKVKNNQSEVSKPVELQKLEIELNELRNERNHLNSCLEELQLEHQSNLDQVISLKDKYKNELEALRKEYNILKVKCDESLINESKNETNLLKSKIKELELLIDKEKTKSQTEIENEKVRLGKLVSEIQVLSQDKQKLEESQKFFQNEYEQLRGKLIELEKTNQENEIKLSLLSNEKEELLKKYKDEEALTTQLSFLTKTETEIKEKLKNLSQELNINISDSNIIKILNLIEAKCRELNDSCKSQNEFEIELKKLTEDNNIIQDKIKICEEMENKYQKEISHLKSTISEMKAQEQDCMNQSQTDDVKRLEQEIAQCTSLLHLKNNEITDYSVRLQNLEKELMDVKTSSLTIQEELSTAKAEKSKLEEEIVNLKNINTKDNQDKVELVEKVKVLELEAVNRCQQYAELQNKLEEHLNDNKKIQSIQEELEKAEICKSEKMQRIEELEKENLNLKTEFEHLKAEIIIRDSKLGELMKMNTFFQEEMNKLQAQNTELINAEKEIKKWKDASVDLQIQLEDFIAKSEELDNRYKELQNELTAKNLEIQNLKTLVNEFQSNSEQSERQKQEELILQLQEENSELKSRIQKFQEQMKVQIFQQQTQHLKTDPQQHRRSKSDVDSELTDGSNSDLTLLKEALQQEQSKYQILQSQFLEISNREANARKEFERLKQHLLEIEDHYTEEAVESEKIINDLKTKLIASEEQLQNSSTLYTSLKVRDNQHLESLQSQIRMITAQRDDFQAKLSAAEDEVQKHKASLMSLQIVLEQFQQDKELELEQLAISYEKKLQSCNDCFKKMEIEIQGLKNQLNEAKNGLKAASRLGEQLEKKTQRVTELEQNLALINNRVVELESSLASENQANNGKVDKFLIKNLIVSYIISPNADRKSQVLRIIASVLDFDQDEKLKMGVDANRSGWLSNILHPKGDSPQSNQSLSEAFIRFLENESRPTPQLRLHPEQYEASSSKTTRQSPKPSGHLSELMLPTFNSSNENESSIILKNVLKDS